MKPRRNFPKVRATIADGPTINVTGREALTLLALAQNGSRGVSGIDFPGGPAYRLGAYVFDLRGMGVGIRTDREEHSVGTHARYVLTTPVTIEAVDFGDGRAAA
ncbi:hypothetical protein ABIE41_001484 [Bosea sp. OAE506]|uniref:winged helix domain-containing protein n=1 Tax=Bosea sp. OAE506 TaxID=2663870 RepID=UPI0017897E7A